MRAFAIAAAGVLLAGCTEPRVIETIQYGVDGVATKYGVKEYVDAGREKLAEAEAKKVGRVLLPRGAEASSRVLIDGSGSVLTNGVYEVQTFVLRRALTMPLAPFTIPAPVATNTYISNAPTVPPSPVPAPATNAPAPGDELMELLEEIGNTLGGAK